MVTGRKHNSGFRTVGASAQRRYRRVKGKTKIRVKAAAAVLILLLALALFLWLPAFRVGDIVIRGVHRLDQDMVAGMAGLETGAHMWLGLDMEGVVQRLVDSCVIESAAVSRSLPSRLIIEVQETAAAARIAADNGYYLVDAGGTVIGKSQGDDVLSLPLIEGVSGEVTVGQALDTDYELAVAVAEAVIAVGLDVSWIEQCAERGVIVVSDNVVVIVGFSGTDLIGRLLTLPHILQDAREQGFAIEYVDISSRGRPLIRIRGDDNE